MTQPDARAERTPEPATGEDVETICDVLVEFLPQYDERNRHDAAEAIRAALNLPALRRRAEIAEAQVERLLTERNTAVQNECTALCDDIEEERDALRAALGEAEKLVRTVHWFGTGFAYDPPGGDRVTLDPARVTVFIGAEQQAERERLAAERDQARDDLARAEGERAELIQVAVAYEAAWNRYSNPSTSPDLTEADRLLGKGRAHQDLLEVIRKHAGVKE